MKKNILRGLYTAGIIAITMSGCATQPKPLYTYGDYSGKYYSYKQNMSPESALELQKSIEYAITNTENTLSNRVAPGMYANLGYIYLKSGNTDKAIENFNNEKSIYPESAHFMDRMIKKIEVAQGENK